MSEVNGTPARRVRPKDAASLILVRQTEGALQVLMGRRAKRHRFLPEVFVFPGGRVDAQDRRAAVLKPYRAEILRALQEAGSGGLAQALGCAAVRETWEETGLHLGRLSSGELHADLSALDYVARAITPSESPIRFHARFFLADAAKSSGTIGGSGELLDLAFYDLDAALRLPLADVTEFVLRELQRRFHAGDRPRALFWRYRNGVPLVDRG